MAVSVLLCMTVFVAACGKKDEPVGSGSAQVESQAVAVTEGVAGAYTLYAMGQGDQLVDAKEYMQFMQSFVNGLSESMSDGESTSSDIQMDFTSESLLQLAEDGTVEMSMAGQTVAGTWTDDNGKVTIMVSSEDENGTKVETTYTGEQTSAGILTLTSEADEANGAATMVYVKEGADTSSIQLSSLQDMMNTANTQE